MNIIDLVAYHPGENLSRIKEASYAYKYQDLDVNVFKSSIGTFFVDLVKNSIKEREANQTLYHYIKTTLVDLDQAEKLALLPIQYALELAVHLGFQLSDNYSLEKPYFDLQSGEFIDNDVRHNYILNEAVSRALYQVVTNTEKVKLTKVERTLVLDALMKYYRLHIEEFKELRSLPVIRAILS